MAKGDLLAKRKEARKKNAEENKGLKLKKNWYPVSDLKSHFTLHIKDQKYEIETNLFGKMNYGYI